MENRVGVHKSRSGSRNQTSYFQEKKFNIGILLSRYCGDHKREMEKQSNTEIVIAERIHCQP
jgi:hypothetical protein